MRDREPPIGENVAIVIMLAAAGAGAVALIRVALAYPGYAADAVALVVGVLWAVQVVHRR